MDVKNKEEASRDASLVQRRRDTCSLHIHLYWAAMAFFPPCSVRNTSSP